MDQAAPIVGITPQQYGQVASDSGDVLSSIYQDIGTSLDSIAKSTASVGYVDGNGNTDTMITAAHLARLGTEQKIQELMKSANWDQISQEATSDLANLFEQQRQLTDTITQKSSVSLFDDPLGALSNAFTMPWDQQNLDAVNEKIAVESDTKNKIDNMIQQSAKVTLDAESAYTEADIKDQATRLAGVANIRAQAANINALKSNADGVMAVMKMNDAAMNAYTTAHQLANSDAQLAMAQARDAREATMYQYAVKKHEGEDEFDTQSLALANKALLADGKDPITDLTKFRFMKGAQAAYVNELVTSGLKLVSNPMAPQGSGVLDSVQYRQLTGNLPTTQVGKTIADLQNEALRQAQLVPGVGKDKAVIAAEANKIYLASINAKAANINTNDQTNPFVAQSYATMSKAPGVASNPLWQKYVAPLITDANSKTPMDPQRLLDSLTDGLMKQEITLKQASQFYSTLFQRSNAINNEANKLQRIAGFEQQAYHTSVNIGDNPLGNWTTIGFHKVPVNASDQVVVQQIMARNIVLKSGIGGMISNAGLNPSDYELGPGALGKYPDGWNFATDGLYPPLNTYLQKKAGK